MFLSRDEAREYMRTHATEHLKSDRVSERSGIIKGYICPICGSVTHDKGTGITLLRHWKISVGTGAVNIQ